MKNSLITFILVVSAFIAHPQSGSITSITVKQRTDGSGFVDIYFNLMGSSPFYNIYLEASFDSGSTYHSVPTTYLGGDVSGISPGRNKHIYWDGFASFPETYSIHAKLKIVALANTGNHQPGQGVTDIDGNLYPSVIIGNQEWMAENLRVTRNANGNNIIRLCYNDNQLNCEFFGGLYNWETVMNGFSSSNANPSNVQGICPIGWHVPSDSEWSELLNFLISQGFPNEYNNPEGASNSLKSCRQVSSPFGDECATTEQPRWDFNNIHSGKDEFGFSAFPGGVRDVYGSYHQIGANGRWWTSTDDPSINAGWWWFLGVDRGDILRFGSHKLMGHSVRCVKN